MTKSETGFPILNAKRDGFAASVPWSVAEPARAQAFRNHGQTLERLAERGGLSVRELACALLERALFPFSQMPVLEEAKALILARLSDSGRDLK